jgi:hypothetical protein
MLDFSHIPSQQQSTFTFYANSGSWQTFVKPRNAKFLEIFCLGGGGGGGHTTISAAAAIGAGAGGSAGIVRGIIPAFLLPDTLYIQVGKGGAGAKASATVGGTGGISYISLDGTTSEQALICKSSTSTATGGANTATAGAGATVAVTALSAFSNLGLFTAIVGVAGSTGGANTGTAGTSQTALGTNIVTGGAGGGGKTASVFGAGGDITAAPVILTTTVKGGVTAGQDGADGYGTLIPFCGTGGAGGAGVTTGAGGKGGKGFYGCGGGGVGGGSVVSAAGDGGDGLVIITVIS